MSVRESVLTRAFLSAFLAPLAPAKKTKKLVTSTNFPLSHQPPNQADKRCEKSNSSCKRANCFVLLFSPPFISLSYFQMTLLDGLTVISVQLRACTSTLHVRPSTWRLLLVLELLTLFTSLFLGFYCADSSRCPSANYWPQDVWGETRCNSKLCENCDLTNLIRSPKSALSTVSFVMVAWIILVWGIEDYYYFQWSKGDGATTTPLHKLQDYNSSSSPNLILGAAGVVHVLFSLLGFLALFYAGLGAFLYHASFTRQGVMYDVASVWTLW